MYRFLRHGEFYLHGFWYAWGIGNASAENTDESYMLAFQRIANIFKNEVKATNVKIIWAINNTNEGQGPPTPNTTDSYPGDAYVDYIGLDGYNWGEMCLCLV